MWLMPNESYLFAAAWLFFAAWSVAIAVVSLAAFGRDLFPSRLYAEPNTTARLKTPKDPASPSAS